LLQGAKSFSFIKLDLRLTNRRSGRWFQNEISSQTTLHFVAAAANLFCSFPQQTTLNVCPI